MSGYGKSQNVYVRCSRRSPAPACRSRDFLPPPHVGLIATHAILSVPCPPRSDNFLNERSSTRVHAPPGGGSSLSWAFGGEEAPAAASSVSGWPERGSRPTSAASHPVLHRPLANPAQGRGRKVEKEITGKVGGAAAAAAPAPLREISHSHFAAPAPAMAPAAKCAPAAGGVSMNKFANGASQNTGNVMTDRSSTRIHAPPGGRSQITFG
jgi:SPIRAL1-like protein